MSKQRKSITKRKWNEKDGTKYGKKERLKREREMRAIKCRGSEKKLNFMVKVVTAEWKLLHKRKGTKYRTKPAAQSGIKTC